MKKDYTWATLFSQSGSEILEVSKQVGRFPDIIVTNKSLEKLETINPTLLECAFDRFVFVPKVPTHEEYVTALKHANIVTLHGYLRILPPSICHRYNTFNGHPGLITLYPELKGKDPQKKVWESDIKYDKHGHVIHKVIGEVDAGTVMKTKSFNSGDLHKEFVTLDRYISTLHKIAVSNWVDFLRERLNIKR